MTAAATTRMVIRGRVTRYRAVPWGLGIWALVVSLSAVAAEPLTPWDVARLRYVTDAAIDPAGNRIAFLVAVPRFPGRDPDGPAWSELHVWDVRSQRSRPYVSGRVNVSRLGWLPDGSGITFLAKRADDQFTSLYVIPIDGGEARRVVALKSNLADYALHPNGREVILLARPPKPQAKRQWEEKGFRAEIFEEEPSRVALWSADLDPETDDSPVMWDLEGSWSEVHFDPSGSRLVAAVAPSDRVDDQMMFRRLKILDYTTRRITTSLDNPGKLGAVRWSPDGKYLAFLSGEDKHDPSEGRLMLAEVEKGTFKPWIPDYYPDISHIEWWDEKTVLFVAEDSCLSALGRIRTDQDSPEVLLSGTPIWSSLSLSRSVKVAALVGHSWDHPSELFLMRLESQPEAQRCTHLNPWLKERRLGEQQIVSYRARDGQTIEGVLIRPVAAKTEEPAPLIVAVHGGPESRVAHGWVTTYSNPGQMAAGKGFYVFYPNYRGSTGRGVAFAKAHQSDYAGREFQDIIDGVDYLVSQGWVDPKRVGVTGGSYGGFATAWCSTYYSQRFAAGVMFVGISDQISKAGTTDIPEEMYLVHARKRLWEDWQFFLERSPIFHVTRCRTPLLILHGKEDTRVPPSQSQELYRHLKTLGQAPVRLVYYPGEGHGNRNAAARLDYSLRMLQWFEHYLQGPGGEPPPYELDYQLPGDSGMNSEK
ncbi:MAG: peptidase S9 [Pirellulaceae bacterium]|nr:MAG: peptidase S9 [Pirellulaceae bacterium]